MRVAALGRGTEVLRWIAIADFQRNAAEEPQAARPARAAFPAARALPRLDYAGWRAPDRTFQQAACARNGRG